MEKKKMMITKKKRMKNMLAKPRWNTGLKISDDPRLEKLCSWKGKTTHNAIKCKLIDFILNKEWEGESLLKLSEISPISYSSINRILKNKASKNLKKRYKLIIL